MEIEEVLIKLKNNDDWLFIAAEEGARKFQNNINVVVNPKSRMKSKV